MDPTILSATPITPLPIAISFSVVLLTSFFCLSNAPFISWHCFSFQAASQVSREFVDKLSWNGTPRMSPGAGAEVNQWKEKCLIKNAGLLSLTKKKVSVATSLKMAMPYVLVQPWQSPHPGPPWQMSPFPPLSPWPFPHVETSKIHLKQLKPCHLSLKILHYESNITSRSAGSHISS